MANSSRCGGTWCSAPNCHNSRKKGWRLFSFPCDEERCRKWVQNCRRSDLIGKSASYLRANCCLCSDHFESTQLMNPTNPKCRLIWNAVPTLFDVSSTPNTRRKPVETQNVTDEADTGFPAASWDKNHTDWIPTLNMGHDIAISKRCKKIPIRSEQKMACEERLSPLPPSAEINFKVEIDIAEDIPPYGTAEHYQHTQISNTPVSQKQKSTGAKKCKKTSARKRKTTDASNVSAPEQTNINPAVVHYDRTDFMTANVPTESNYLLQPSEIKTEVDDLPVLFAAERNLLAQERRTHVSCIPPATAPETPRTKPVQSDTANNTSKSFSMESHHLLQPSEIKTEVDDVSEDYPVSSIAEHHQEKNSVPPLSDKPEVEADDDGGWVSGDDLTDEEEPDIATSLRMRGQEEKAECLDYVPELDMDSDSDSEYLVQHALSSHQTEFPAQEGAPSTCSENSQILIAKDGTAWSSKPPSNDGGRSSIENVFRCPATQLVGCAEVTHPVDSFQLFMSDQMIKTIVVYTNAEGIRLKGEEFKKTDEVEIRGLLGCLICLGGMKQNMMQTTIIWDSLYGQSLVRATMGRKRFLELLACMRFDDKTSRNTRRAIDVFAPFRDFWRLFTDNLRSHYIAGPFVTVGEQLIPFRGRCNFIQYLPSKPDRYGIKIFWAADAETNYPLVAEPYLGQSLGAEREANLGRNTAIKLLSSFANSGRNITCDKFFTDTVLSDTLFLQGLTLVGMVSTNKRFLPEPFKVKRGQALHESTFVFDSSKTTLVNYQSKSAKNVVVLSTMHHDAFVDPMASKRKPDIVKFYNSTKGAVDSLDKLAHTYTCKRITKRWPMVLFYNTVDLATIAARVVWEKKFPKHPLSAKNTRLQFLLKLAEQLCMGQMQKRLAQKTLQSTLKTLINTCLDRINTSDQVVRQKQKKRPATDVTSSTTSANKAATAAPPTEKKMKAKRGRCTACHWKKDRKATKACASCNDWLCKDHSICICPKCYESMNT